MANVPDPSRLVASCTCADVADTACCAPFWRNPDGTAFVSTPGAPIPMGLVLVQRLTAYTFAIPPTPEPV